MVSYEHTHIKRALNELGEVPTTDSEHSSWIRAKGHLQLLRQNARDPEVIIYAYSKEVFIHAVIAKEFEVTQPDIDDMLDWYSTPYIERANFSWTGEASDVRVEFTDTSPIPRTLNTRQNLVFGRRMEGTEDPYNYELLQEFVHTTGIHWREEQRAYCCVDENGDITPVVSITKPDSESGLTLITCKREHLEQYLVATENVLVRFFDLMMVKRDKFTSWDAGTRKREIESQSLFYDQCVHPGGHGFTRGTQILPVVFPKQNLFRSITDPNSLRSGRQYASFMALDWRHDTIVEISTDPKSTTNYFQAESNSLPLELSPVFFRPEVLSKYKSDRDKYTIHEGTRVISCRDVWELRSYDINEAGQVHAYICYLRHLPYSEQLHWKIYNEPPKGNISGRAFENDFLGLPSSHITGLGRILRVVNGWVRQKPAWWQINNEALLLRVTTPVSNSKDEWAQAFLELSKVVIEGFQPKPIRELLRQENISFEKEDRTLTLLEKLLDPGAPSGHRPTRLQGLRTAYQIRSKVHSHIEGSRSRRDSTRCPRGTRHVQGPFRTCLQADS